jgi:hypothetical protein
MPRRLTPQLTHDCVLPQGKPPSTDRAKSLLLAFFLYSLGVGYYAAVRPDGKWKNPFSWHPFLMTVGMIGCMGIATITKKLGGYVNTKNHGLLGNLGVLLSLGGFFAIYRSKNLYGKEHFTSTHGKAGLAVIVASIGAGLVGGIFLHPDFGSDKTNKTLRFAHKTFARCVLASAWTTAFYGFYTMTKNPVELAIFGLPLLVLAPFTLV